MAVRKIVPQEIVTQVQRYVWENCKSSFVPGFVPFDKLDEALRWRSAVTGNRFSLHFDGKGWAVTASLEIDIGEKSASISWSSTGRSIASAVAAVALYQHVIELAAQVECFMKTFKE
jgi:hypothetical protein